MTPDKIYIFKDGDELWYKPEEWETPPPGRVEYIRKDALLQWVEAVKHVYELPLNGRDASKICSSKADAFQMVIDELNSM